MEGYAWCLRCEDWVKDTLIMLRFNKDLWDEHELVILMKRAAYGTRLSNSAPQMINLLHQFRVHHLLMRLVVAVVVVVVK